MLSFPNRTRRRRIVRRALRTHCQAIALDGFRYLGDQGLDLSPYGMLLACDEQVQLGEYAVVGFRVPGDDQWFETEAKVVRIIEGYRLGDPGYAAGLRFTHMDVASRLKLHELLRGLPPPVPSRTLPFLAPRAGQSVSRFAVC